MIQLHEILQHSIVKDSMYSTFSRYFSTKRKWKNHYDECTISQSFCNEKKLLLEETTWFHDIFTEERKKNISN